MKIFSFGAVLWDVIEGREYIGGAPFNLAAHWAQLGGEAFLISRVGCDRRGTVALAVMQRLGVRSRYVQRDVSHPTGWVDVRLIAGGQPEFTIHSDVAFDFIATTPLLLYDLKREALDAFCFGTLEQRAPVARVTLFKILDRIRARHVFYDVNLRQNFFDAERVGQSLVRSTIVKLNAAEAVQLSGLLYGRRLAERQFAARLRADYPRLELICVTKGARGCTVYADGPPIQAPGVRVKVADTVGAGDAFGAAFLLAYQRTRDPLASAGLANRIGAFVASRRGAVPEYTPEIKRLVEETLAR
jgi:fructokinase